MDCLVDRPPEGPIESTERDVGFWGRSLGDGRIGVVIGTLKRSVLRDVLSTIWQNGDSDAGIFLWGNAISAEVG